MPTDDSPRPDVLTGHSTGPSSVEHPVRPFCFTERRSRLSALTQEKTPFVSRSLSVKATRRGRGILTGSPVPRDLLPCCWRRVH